MINRSLLISIFTLSTSLFGMQVLEISPQHVMKSHELSDISLGLSQDSNFYVKQHNKIHKVQKAFVDKDLRNISPEKLQKFLGKGYLSLQKLGNDEYTVKAKVRGLGGGAGGATVGTIVGASVVQGAYWGFTAAIGSVGGPMAAGIWCYWTSGALVVATHTAAVAGGLAGAVITGPI